VKQNTAKLSEFYISFFRIVSATQDVQKYGTAYQYKYIKRKRGLVIQTDLLFFCCFSSFVFRKQRLILPLFFVFSNF